MYRLVLIVYNHKYDEIFSVRNVNLMVAFCWIASFAMTLPALFRVWGQNIILRTSATYYCGLLPNPHPKGSSPATVLYAFGFFVPFVAIVITYAMIYWKVRRHAQQFMSSKANRTNYKFFKVIMLIFVGFLICYLPNLIMRAFDKRFKGGSGPYPYWQVVLVRVLLYSNACINPIIYFGLNKDYMNALKTLLGIKTTQQGQISPATADSVLETAVN